MDVEGGGLLPARRIDFVAARKVLIPGHKTGIYDVPRAAKVDDAAMTECELCGHVEGAADTERARCLKIASGISEGILVAAGRLLRGYGHLHPGIEGYVQAFERSARELVEKIRSGE